MIRGSGSTIRLAAFLLASLTLVGRGVTGQKLRIEYEGVFAPPHYPVSGPRYGYGMKGMAYSPDCAGATDPSPDDGHPGCLLATSHVKFDLVGLFDIPAPHRVTGKDRTDAFWGERLVRSATVVEFFDPSGGLKQQLDEQPGWQARDIPGVELVGSDLISTCGHDWYNVALVDHDSHCWAKLGPNGAVSEAIGAYNFGPAKDKEKKYHADKMSHYVGVIGQRFADEHLGAEGSKMCFSGRQREGGGAPGRSQGPTLYAFDCSRPTVEPPGWLGAKLLLTYRPNYPLSVTASDFPEYSPTNECMDAVWIEERDVRGVLFACQQGGPFWWYGLPDPWKEPNPDRALVNTRNRCRWNQGNPITDKGVPCMKDFLSYGPAIPCYEYSDSGKCLRGLIDRCYSSKGFHGVFEHQPQSKARLLWYPEQGLAEVLKGTRKPWQVPFEIVLDQPAETWPACAGAFGGVALDGERRWLYVAQIERGESPVIHVYRIESD